MKKFKLEFLKNGEDQEDYYVKSTDGRPYKIQWQKPHETVSRELWKNNTLGKNYQSARHRKDSYNDSNKKHHSLPVPSKKKVEEKPRQREIVVDPRRFGMVDPFTFSGKNFTMDNSALDFASYFAQEIQKEEEKRKQRESVDSSIKSVNSTNSTDSVGETTNKGIIRSRRESLQSMRQDSRTSRRESLQSMRQDSLHESQQPVIQDNRTSRRESQQSFRRDSRASHQETNVERFQNILPSTPEHEETDTSSLISISNKPPLPKKSSSRFRESKVPGTCLTCRGKIAEGGYCTQWCQPCESRKFERKFGTWTSGSDVIDTLILESQLGAKSRFDYLEWIPFNRFKDVQLIGSGGIGSVYQAIWLDGPREKWDNKSRQYIRCGEWRVALRSIDNSENVALGFFDELKAHLCCENNSGNYIIRYYGITQDTETKDYMIVVQYARNGNLRKYMKKNPTGIIWKRKLDILFGAATALYRIHRENIVHRNLHSGNVLINSYMTLISDLGIYNRADNHEMDGTFGVLPYVSPELLRGKPLTTAADIYSFGTIMWELAFGRKPFNDRAHNLELATDIINGLRPEIIEEIPECYLKLMKSCWDSDPFMRPSAEKLYGILGDWLCKAHNVPNSEIAMQFSEAEQRRLESIKQGTKSSSTPEQIESPVHSPTTYSSFNNIGENVHSEAAFKSRYLKFESLQEPTIIFTRTYHAREHLALQEYLTAETEAYNAKYEAIQADNTEIAAEIYEIMQYL
ncbi:Cdc15p [Rhizophagus irregularis DAOM 197198w]|uniref:Cdc15p n=1 Tax=Rhizophagus irregularis (strain DAOM 197198w) TaxID=1432141 RepID=A0A015KUS1_RHIIW|nr:Cdc15p [Rhizophagus irregularis DAOM 197198w]